MKLNRINGITMSFLFLPALLASANAAETKADFPTDLSADLTLENSAKLICTPMANAMSLFFTGVQDGIPVKIGCRLASLEKLDDTSFKAWLEADRDKTKRCIHDTAFKRKMFKGLGYDIDRDEIDAGAAAKKFRSVTPEALQKLQAESEPGNDFSETEFRDIRAVYLTTLVMSGDGNEAPPAQACTFVTRNNFYICADGKILCRKKPNSSEAGK